MAKNDLELIAEIKAGNEESFELLTDRYAAKVYSLATKLVKNREDAEDVLQDVFVTVFKKLDAFEGKSSFSSWLYRITVNAALMRIRKKDRIQASEELLADAHLEVSHQTPQTLDDLTYRKEMSRFLDDAIKTLPIEYRPVFVLRDVNGLTCGEVSRILNVSVPAVKSRLHRSRFLLREKLINLYVENCDGRENCKVGNL